RHDDASAILDALPDAVSTPELAVACAEGEHHALIARLAASADFPGATDVVRIDGLRVEYPDGFGLARASNTTPTIVLRFEADDAAALDRLKGEFRRVLRAVKPGIDLPIAGAVYLSPCVESIPLSQLTGAHIFCKLDYLQRTGSFKERGARNALLMLTPEPRERGAIAASAGSHAQGIAYHGSLLGIPITVVMPKFAALVKVTNC